MWRAMTRRTAILAIACAAACNENAAHEQMAEARRLSNLLTTQFAQAARASDRTVMADTDEAAFLSSKEAQSAVDAARASAATLGPILERLRYSDEAQLLQEFERRFSQYRALDNSILALAVESTNTRAQRLSFGVAQEAADALRDALESIEPARAAQAWQVRALAATTLASAREVQVLQGPHIAEADDAAMARLESRMAEAEANARKSMAGLDGIVSASSRPHLSKATRALDRLTSLNAEIRSLSRRNSNVRALAVSLGQKQVVSAACESTLRALQDALAGRGLPSR